MASGNDRELPFHALRPHPAGTGQAVPYDPRMLMPEEDESIDLRQYWRVLAKRKWLIFAVLVIFVAAAYFATKLQVPEYRATASVLIEMPAPPAVLSIPDYESAWHRRQEFMPTQLRILTSRALAESVVRREGLETHPQLTGEIRQRSVQGEARELARLALRVARSQVAAILRGPTESAEPAGTEEPADVGEASEPDAPRAAGRDPAVAAAGRLRGGIEVVQVRNTSVVNISYVSFDPSFSARVANAIVREYSRDAMERRLNAGLQAREFLEDRLNNMRIAIEAADQELADFARRTGAASLAENLDMARGGLRGLNSRLDEVRRELVELTGWRDLIQAGRVDYIDPITNSASIATLRSQLLETNAEYARLSQRFLDSYPDVAEVLRRAELLRQEIEREKRDIANGVLGRFETLNAQEMALEEAIAERESMLIALNERGVQYNILRREFEANQALYDGILERLKEVGVIAGVQENHVSVIDEARRPGAPFRPNLRKNLGMAAMVALAVGVMLAFLLEFLDNTIRRSEDVERLVDRPVLGMVPLIRMRDRGKKTRRSRRSGHSLAHICITQPKSSISEAFRSLRTSLMFSTAEGMPKSLLVTSSAQGEGKSTAAANIATVLAQNGARVLLIDADLRRPTLHRDFNLPRSPGLTDSITQPARMGTLEAPAIHGTEVPGLSVMPAGHSTPSPAELLSSSHFLKVLAGCRKIFDHVIIDAPPILGLADAVILSRLVDGVILVVASGGTGKESFRMSVRGLCQV
jgi:polysaccharide biosynthesis transport protein